MNLFTKPMRLLTAVVLEETSDAVVKALLELGLLDFVHLNHLDPAQMEKLSTRPSAVSRTMLEDLRMRVEALLRQGHLALPTSDGLDVSRLEKPELDSYRSTLDDLTAKLLSIKEEQKQNNQILMGIEEMRRYLDEEKGEYLDLRVGTAASKKREELATKLAPYGGIVADLDENGLLATLSLRRDVGHIDPLLEKFGWTEASDPALQRQGIAAVRKSLEDARHAALAGRDESEQAADAIIAEKREELFGIWSNLRLNELSDQIKGYFSYTRNTTLFSGWVPADQANIVSDAITTASEGQCVIEWTEATEVNRAEVPVAITSPKALKPFQNMVNNYATPEYGTVNPTIFVMVAYLAMFGLMFADLGQGFVLLLVGLLMGRSYRKNPLKPDGMINRNVADLLVYLGLSSMLFGLLFGSTFGLPLIPPLWFNYEAVVAGHAPAGSLISDVYGILGLTIKFGIVIIYAGLLLNWINLARKRSYLTLIMDKNGLVGGLLFGIGLYMGFGFVATDYHSFPSQPWIAPTVVVALLALFARPFITAFTEAKKSGTKIVVGALIMDGIMEWLVDVLEIFTGYLSNTLSFMRVAGLGIAHASLMESFKQLSSLVDGFGGIAIFILGNLLVIVLEGLSAGIQSLRLNYYEFFSRYFTGKGVAYQPVGLRSPSRKR
ncbi:MAG: V-type ATPase 116kDa subunit family protein [Sphaerochaeta sp.]|jgi:V/A-type H+-transporting ATPase subunit I